MSASWHDTALVPVGHTINLSCMHVLNLNHVRPHCERLKCRERPLCIADDAIDLKTILSQIPEELRCGPEEALVDGLSLPKGEEEKNLKSLQATVDLGNEHTYTAVVLPADHR